MIRTNTCIVFVVSVMVKLISTAVSHDGVVNLVCKRMHAHATQPSSSMPTYTFDESSGETIRLRFINGGISAGMMISIENHQMTIAASDGINLKPLTTAYKVPYYLVYLSVAKKLLFPTPDKFESPTETDNCDNRRLF
jgi:hypothetical protein